MELSRKNNNDKPFDLKEYNSSELNLLNNERQFFKELLLRYNGTIRRCVDKMGHSERHLIRLVKKHRLETFIQCIKLCDYDHPNMVKEMDEIIEYRTFWRSAGKLAEKATD